MTIDESPNGVATGAADPSPTDLEVVGAEYMLRLATQDDAQELFELGSDPAVTRFFSWGPYTSADQPLDYIESLRAKRDSGQLLEFVIVEREAEKIVGVTGLTEFSKRDRRAVVGSWLGHKYWGRGVNYASKSLVLGLGFKHLGLDRISSYSHVRNGRSRSALERIGFINEGTLHGWHYHRGEPQDVNIHCLLRDLYERSPMSSDELAVSGGVPPAFLPAATAP
ncbi:MAG: GNAT family N-acetyltransferase [Solirubrobacterales bacterium]